MQLIERDYSLFVGKDGCDIYSSLDNNLILDLADIISKSLISILLEKEERMIV